VPDLVGHAGDPFGVHSVEWLVKDQAVEAAHGVHEIPELPHVASGKVSGIFIKPLRHAEAVRTE
jgi:hypothetical protein